MQSGVGPDTDEITSHRGCYEANKFLELTTICNFGSATGREGTAKVLLKLLKYEYLHFAQLPEDQIRFLCYFILLWIFFILNKELL